jgi:hypothetical protein
MASELTMSEGTGGIRARGEEAIGDLAQALLENPLFSQALGKALGAGERAAQAQKAALGALDVSSASDLERLNRRVRALSDRVEALEDELDATRRELARAKQSTSTSS